MPTRNQEVLVFALTSQIVFHRLCKRKTFVRFSQKALVSLEDYLTTDGTRNAIIARSLNTNRGRTILANAMVAPIRRALNYQGIGRRLLQVDELPQGAYVSYSQPEFVGSFPIRQDVTILPSSQPRRLQPGWTYSEESDGSMTLTRTSRPSRPTRRQSRHRR